MKCGICGQPFTRKKGAVKGKNYVHWICRAKGVKGATYRCRAQNMTREFGVTVHGAGKTGRKQTSSWLVRLFLSSFPHWADARCFLSGIAGQEDAPVNSNNLDAVPRQSTKDRLKNAGRSCMIEGIQMSDSEIMKFQNRAAPGGLRPYRIKTAALSLVV